MERERELEFSIDQFSKVGCECLQAVVEKVLLDFYRFTRVCQIYNLHNNTTSKVTNKRLSQVQVAQSECANLFLVFYHSVQSVKKRQRTSQLDIEKARHHQNEGGRGRAYSPTVPLFLMPKTLLSHFFWPCPYRFFGERVQAENPIPLMSLFLIFAALRLGGGDMVTCTIWGSLVINRNMSIIILVLCEKGQISFYKSVAT